MKRPDYLNQIRGNIERAEAGSVFVSTDFTDITDKKTVNMGLIRLADEGLIKKSCSEFITSRSSASCSAKPLPRHRTRWLTLSHVTSDGLLSPAAIRL